MKTLPFVTSTVESNSPMNMALVETFYTTQHNVTGEDENRIVYLIWFSFHKTHRTWKYENQSDRDNDYRRILSCTLS